MAQRPIKWCCLTQTEQYVGLLARCRKISIDFHSYSLGGWGGVLREVRRTTSRQLHTPENSYFDAYIYPYKSARMNDARRPKRLRVNAPPLQLLHNIEYGSIARRSLRDRFAVWLCVTYVW